MQPRFVSSTSPVRRYLLAPTHVSCSLRYGTGKPLGARVSTCTLTCKRPIPLKAGMGMGMGTGFTGIPKGMPYENILYLI